MIFPVCVSSFVSKGKRVIHIATMSLPDCAQKRASCYWWRHGETQWFIGLARSVRYLKRRWKFRNFSESNRLSMHWCLFACSVWVFWLRMPRCSRSPRLQAYICGNCNMGNLSPSPCVNGKCCTSWSLFNYWRSAKMLITIVRIQFKPSICTVSNLNDRPRPLLSVGPHLRAKILFRISPLSRSIPELCTKRRTWRKNIDQQWNNGKF